MDKESMRAKCVCENCKPNVEYTKEEWAQFKHYCPKCQKSLNIRMDKSGEIYQVEVVEASALKKGDYINFHSYYFQIVNIEESTYKDNHLFISALGYGSHLFRKDESVWRIIT